MSMIDTQTAVANTLSTSIVSSSDLPKDLPVTNNTIDLAMSMTMDLMKHHTSSSFSDTINTHNKDQNINNMSVSNIINTNTKINTNSNSNYNNTNSNTSINNTTINTIVDFNNYNYIKSNSSIYSPYTKDSLSYSTPPIQRNFSNSSFTPNSLNCFSLNSQINTNSLEFQNYIPYHSNIDNQNQSPSQNISYNSDVINNNSNPLFHNHNQSNYSYISPQNKINNLNSISNVESSYNSNIQQPYNTPISNNTHSLSNITPPYIQNNNVNDKSPVISNMINSNSNTNNFFKSSNDIVKINCMDSNNNNYDSSSSDNIINQNVYHLKDTDNNRQNILPPIGTLKQHIPIHTSSSSNSSSLSFLLNNTSSQSSQSPKSSHYILPSLTNSMSQQIPGTPDSWVDDNQHRLNPQSIYYSSNSKSPLSSNNSSFDREKLNSISNHEILSPIEKINNSLDGVRSYTRSLPNNINNNISSVQYSLSNYPSAVSSTSQFLSKRDGQDLYTSPISSSLSSPSLSNHGFMNSPNR
ncbi:hypothetical protein PIROE2DRAFT_9617 [Piromyces sp. E2]|nr:hypothetical protein PIROE2DRAFT_9617 [Piromyces sp. E2]|eukprot:OUM63755.1 hypothetical protein PIROE2DRAFT_9617 [Piromyces sp. E2]